MTRMLSSKTHREEQLPRLHVLHQQCRNGKLCRVALAVPFILMAGEAVARQVRFPPSCTRENNAFGRWRNSLSAAAVCLYHKKNKRVKKHT